MSEPAEARRMTVTEFLAWDGGPEQRFELVDGVPVAMAPTRSFHGTIAANAGLEISRRLEPRPPCRAHAEAGVWISDENLWEADVAATCAPPENTAAIVDPFLIVEVLSPSTRTHDKGRKLGDYKELSSVREIWLIESEKRWVEVWQRTDDEWSARDYVARASFTSLTLGADVTLDQLYRNTTL